MLKNLVKGSLILLILFLLSSSFLDTRKEEEIVSTATYNLSDNYDEVKCQSILIIPKINLNKCMNNNDVSKDVAILYDSDTVVLASHSGNAKNAYFRNLYKLTYGDEVIFYHHDIKNIYIVKEIKTKLKKDKLSFANKKDVLILVTCSYTKKDEQLTYYLQKKN